MFKEYYFEYDIHKIYDTFLTKNNKRISFEQNFSYNTCKKSYLETQFMNKKKRRLKKPENNNHFHYQKNQFSSV